MNKPAPATKNSALFELEETDLAEVTGGLAPVTAPYTNPKVSIETIIGTDGNGNTSCITVYPTLGPL